MEQMANDFYQQLYTSEGVHNMEQVLETVPTKVTQEMNELLNAPYSQKEVKIALFQMFPTKAPRPDGYPTHFFQHHWEVCAEEVTQAVLKIVEGTESARCINETMLVLIPKVISSRLKLVLPDVISEEQSAFVPGRLITDNIITAYECLHFMKRNKANKNQSCALKLDMMKAYDRVEWPYLQAIMLKLGFTAKWVDIVMGLVTTVGFSVLFNGKKLRQFNPSRGIRQGDPISPYLFLLATKGLSCLLKSKNESSNLHGIQVAPTAPPVNRLLFADDSLLFFKANGMGANEVYQVLDTYCQATGQRINYSKSSIFFSKGVPDSVRREIKEILNVPNETLNEKYLGMPSNIGSSKNGGFKYLKDRLWGNVQGWIESTMSSAGKEVLVKSVAQAAWRLLQNPNTLCARVLKSIYHPTTDILEAELGDRPSQVWRAVVQGRDILKQGLIKRIGNGASTNIWEHNWLPRDEMLRPYGSLTQNRPTMVSELITPATASWNRQLVQSTFMPMDADIILGIPLCTRNMPDFWAWHYEKHGTFSVRSAYNMIIATRQRREAWLEGSAGPSNARAESGAWKTLWNTAVPGKVRMFLWRLSKQSLPTNDVRAHRHMTDTSPCGFCGVQDSWRHLLLECTVSRSVWALGDEEVMHKIIATTEPNAKNWLFTLIESLSHENFALLAVTAWSIWHARRKAIHEAIYQSPHQTHSFITSYMAELGVINDANRHPRQAVIPAQQQRQNPKKPPSGYYKIHVDAAVRARKGGSAAAVCRDEAGNYVGASTLVLEGVTDPASLEVIACREALCLAEDLNIHNFVVASDCKQVVADIDHNAGGRYRAIISEIHFRTANVQCKFTFECRAANYEAHSLAKLSLSREPGRHVLFGVPYNQNRVPLHVAFDE
ncbi:uncharacterized protein [Aegilops tauschii subsp. strangulata]|uniref:uncharacterized protein n=1 Tax=Aegilops tauschii subsp. strangulata TaxID=200361 RepID=UPI00098AFEB3|nr:uncharacterized protein LOC109738843 [Aegilops tauschii subsp. strangulata]